MNVELQVYQHLALTPQTTVPMVDQYCADYQELFCEVRSYECFKYLHIGIIAPIKRKSLPEIAKVVGLKSSQSLHHFLSNSPWSACDLKQMRLSQTLAALRGEKIIVIIDETGDRKKGNKTDYVARQYLGSVGKIDQGIVSVNAYGLYKNMTFPLLCQVFKPQSKLKEGDVYQTKIEIASEMISELRSYGFKIELVLADSLYGLRTWVEYGFRQCKQELGWTDYRLTQFAQIEKWWELIMSAYLMISLNSQPFQLLNSVESRDSTSSQAEIEGMVHEQWDDSGGWKSVLKNWRLLIQPTLMLWSIWPWLDIFPNTNLLVGFNKLIESINQLYAFYPSG